MGRMNTEELRKTSFMNLAVLDVVLPVIHAHCRKCGHEVREHQPVWGAPARSGTDGTVGCSLCNCQLTMTEKLRAWGGR